MEQYNKRQLIKLIADWQFTEKKTLEDFSKIISVSYNKLHNFKNSSSSRYQDLGDLIASFFKVKYVSTLKESVKYNFKYSDGKAERKKQTEKDSKKLATRRAIEEHLESKQLSAEFGLNF